MLQRDSARLTAHDIEQLVPMLRVGLVGAEGRKPTTALRPKTAASLRSLSNTYTQKLETMGPSVSHLAAANARPASAASTLCLARSAGAGRPSFSAGSARAVPPPPPQAPSSSSSAFTPRPPPANNNNNSINAVGAQKRSETRAEQRRREDDDLGIHEDEEGGDEEGSPNNTHHAHGDGEDHLHAADETARPSDIAKLVGVGKEARHDTEDSASTHPSSSPSSHHHHDSNTPSRQHANHLKRLEEAFNFQRFASLRQEPDGLAAELLASCKAHLPSSLTTPRSRPATANSAATTNVVVGGETTPRQARAGGSGGVGANTSQPLSALNVNNTNAHTHNGHAVFKQSTAERLYRRPATAGTFRPPSERSASRMRAGVAVFSASGGGGGGHTPTTSQLYSKPFRPLTARQMRALEATTVGTAPVVQPYVVNKIAPSLEEVGHAIESEGGGRGGGGLAATNAPASSTPRGGGGGHNPFPSACFSPRMPVYEPFFSSQRHSGIGQYLTDAKRLVYAEALEATAKTNDLYKQQRQAALERLVRSHEEHGAYEESPHHRHHGAGGGGASSHFHTPQRTAASLLASPSSLSSNVGGGGGGGGDASLPTGPSTVANAAEKASAFIGTNSHSRRDVSQAAAVIEGDERGGIETDGGDGSGEAISDDRPRWVSASRPQSAVGTMNNKGLPNAIPAPPPHPLINAANGNAKSSRGASAGARRNSPPSPPPAAATPPLAIRVESITVPLGGGLELPTPEAFAQREAMDARQAHIDQIHALYLEKMSSTKGLGTSTAASAGGGGDVSASEFFFQQYRQGTPRTASKAGGDAAGTAVQFTPISVALPAAAHGANAFVSAATYSPHDPRNHFYQKQAPSPRGGVQKMGGHHTSRLTLTGEEREKEALRVGRAATEAAAASAQLTHQSAELIMRRRLQEESVLRLTQPPSNVLVAKKIRRSFVAQPPRPTNASTGLR